MSLHELILHKMLHISNHTIEVFVDEKMAGWLWTPAANYYKIPPKKDIN